MILPRCFTFGSGLTPSPLFIQLTSDKGPVVIEEQLLPANRWKQFGAGAGDGPDRFGSVHQSLPDLFDYGAQLVAELVLGLDGVAKENVVQVTLECLPDLRLQCFLVLFRLFVIVIPDNDDSAVVKTVLVVIAH